MIVSLDNIEWVIILPEAVKVQSRKARGYDVYLVTIPKRFVEELGLRKGDILFVEIREINGRKTLVYYKPQ